MDAPSGIHLLRFSIDYFHALFLSRRQLRIRRFKSRLQNRLLPSDRFAHHFNSELSEKRRFGA